MERVIKFRSWDETNKEMRYPVASIFDGGFTSGQILDRHDHVMQFTGLTDKNGKEIYEGDIVEYDGTPYNVYALKAIGTIAMVKHSWALKYRSKYHDGYDYYNLGCEDFFNKKSEIIGNVYETPELLNP